MGDAESICAQGALQPLLEEEEEEEEEESSWWRLIYWLTIDNYNSEPSFLSFINHREAWSATISFDCNAYLNFGQPKQDEVRIG